MSGGIILDSENPFKLEVISKLEMGKLTVNQCAQLLGKSERSIFRMLKRYREKAKENKPLKFFICPPHPTAH